MHKLRMIPRKSGWLALVAGAAIIAAGCGSDGASSDGAGDGRTKVIASFYPLAWAAKQVGGGTVDVVNLTPIGAEPHDLELSPSDLDELRSADVVLYLGGFQPALEDAIDSLPDDVRTIDLLDTKGLDTITIDGGDEAGTIDPHVWLDPVRFTKIVQHVGDELTEAGVEGVEPRTKDATGELAVLDAELEQGLAQCERREVFSSHDAFGYLGDRYDLEMRPISGITPDAEPRPRDLEQLADEAKQAGATTIYFETLVAPDVAETLAREVGAKTAVLDPIEGLSREAISNRDDYLDVMRANLATLSKGQGCTSAAKP